jgi:hypothetical protein
MFDGFFYSLNDYLYITVISWIIELSVFLPLRHKLDPLISVSQYLFNAFCQTTIKTIKTFLSIGFINISSMDIFRNEFTE